MPAGQRRVALHKARLTTRTVADAPPERKRYILWDETLIGFGVRVSPTGRRSFIVQFRSAAPGGATANRKQVLGHFPAMAVQAARKRAREVLRSAALSPQDGPDTAGAVPTLRSAFESYLATRPTLAASSREKYRQRLHSHAPDWLDRPLDRIVRADVESRFAEISAGRGPGDRQGGRVAANHFVELLGTLYRSACADCEWLNDPVVRWRAAGGKRHRTARRTIAPPSEVLPRWRTGIEAVPLAKVRDMVWVGLYTGLRTTEVQGLRWEDIDPSRSCLRIATTKSGRTLELPLTRQVAALFERRREARAPVPWVFPGRSPHRPYGQVHVWYRQISDAGGARFWFHACRNCFITVAIRDLMLGDALVKRLVNHAPSRDVTDDYVAPWSLEQLRAPAQRIADRIDALALGGERSASVHAVASPS